MKILVAGPDNCLEFGWFLMRWQAKIRFLSRHYDKTYVITSPDRFIAYSDFARPYNVMSDNHKQDMWRFKKCQVDYIQPSKELCCCDGIDEFVKYGKRSKENKTIVVHMRRKNDKRDWDVTKWHKLLARLRRQFHYPVVSIGPKNESSHLGGCDNCYDGGIDTAIKALNNAVLCVGASSGPMHLASLCGCPHLVWTDNGRWNLGIKKGTNRERYEKVWNPFNTPAYIIDEYGWDPSVEVVFDKIVEVLDGSN